MRIALCDDDRTELSVLVQMIESIRENDALFCYSEGEELLKDMRAGQCFDLCFLDVLMPGINGIRLANEIRALQEEIFSVFITSSTEYALEAFGVGACHYLIKPVDEKQLSEAFSRVQNRGADRRGIYIVAKGNRRFLFFDEIAFCESNGRVMNITLKDGAKVSWYCSFEEMKGQLPDTFLPISRGILVSADYIEKMHTKTCILKDGRELLLSRARAKEIKDAYMEYCFSHLYTPHSVD